MPEKYRTAIQPIINLQENCSSFYNKINEKYGNNINCKKACSKCCYVSLSIFQAEAYRILDWALSLNAEDKKQLLENLLKPEQPERKNTSNKLAKPCSFLIDELCTIYDARPTICRTQGLALQYKVSAKDNNVELAVDHCPLNFTVPDSLPEKADWLDLDRLNTLQSIAENFFAKNLGKDNLNFELKVDKNNRVSMVTLKNILLKILEK